MRDNILKDVYAQDKVELSAMDVELASLKELDALIIQGNKEFDDGALNLTKVKQMISDIKTNYKQASINYTNALKSSDDIIAQLKSLGIEVPGNVSTRQSFIKNNIKESTSKITSLQNIEKSL